MTQSMNSAVQPAGNPRQNEGRSSMRSTSTAKRPAKSGATTFDRKWQQRVLKAALKRLSDH